MKLRRGLLFVVIVALATALVVAVVPPYRLGRAVRTLLEVAATLASMAFLIPFGFAPEEQRRSYGTGYTLGVLAAAIMVTALWYQDPDFLTVIAGFVVMIAGGVIYSLIYKHR